MTKLSLGKAEDLATTVILASNKDILLVPAMNVRMWIHKATQENFKTLKGFGYKFIGPVTGEMACGEYGEGRMSSPRQIYSYLKDYFKDRDEACDDGNTISRDGCNSTCEIETGWICIVDYSGTSICQKCGNGEKEGNETCDDGNKINGDGCSDVCAIETKIATNQSKVNVSNKNKTMVPPPPKVGSSKIAISVTDLNKTAVDIGFSEKIVNPYFIYITLKDKIGNVFHFSSHRIENVSQVFSIDVPANASNIHQKSVVIQDSLINPQIYNKEIFTKIYNGQN